LHVNAGLFSGANDGSSWSNAFQGKLGLQQARSSLSVGATAEIWVVKGTYAPGLPAGGTNAHFALRDGVAIYGGFAGSELVLEQRDPSANPTVLSGDLAANDVKSMPSGVPTWANSSENALHVVRGLGVGPSARLDGVIVRRGNATGSFVTESGRGANVDLIDASPTLDGCVLKEGTASGGGAGLHASGGAPLLRNCTFEGNKATPFGAGAWLQGDTHARFESCVWQSNVGTRGVGMFIGSAFGTPGPLIGAVELVECRFEANSGPISAPAGMGVYVRVARLDALRCSFIDNRSGGGGGGAYVEFGEANFRSCDFVGNSGAFDGGGACYVQGSTTQGSLVRCIDSRFVGNNGVAACVLNGALELTNCTLVANDDNFGGFVFWPVVFATANASAHLANCIVRDHHAPGFTSLQNQFQVAQGSSISIDDSCVEGWNGSLPGIHDFDLDPQFVDRFGLDGLAGTLDDDLTLLVNSPCLDRSNHGWRDLDSDLDVSGLPRYVDQPLVTDAGPTCAPLADLGAHERGPDGPWIDLGFGLGGAGCVPHLVGSGSLLPNASTRMNLVVAAPSAQGFLVLGLTPLEIPLLGGTLVPSPLLVQAWPTSAAGKASFVFAWPSNLAPGTTLYAQAWIFDASAPQSFAASNALLGTAP
jgi:hypothetical protein